MLQETNGLTDLASRMVVLERRRAARWFGVAIAGAPILDVLDDAGWFTLLLGFRHGLDLPPSWATSLAWTGFFVGLAVAGAAILRAMSRRDARWFFAIAAAPIVLYALGRGVRPAALLGLAALVFAGVRVVALPADDDRAHASR
jgi:hypothetical protein